MILINGKEYTKAEARVLVAKDVLKSLKVRKIAPTRGSYVALPEGVPEFKPSKDSKRDARRIQRANCDVCALGACFLSMVALTNEFNFNKMPLGGSDEADLGGILPKLKKIFPLKQLALMETAFEGNRCGSAYEYATKTKEERKEFNRAEEMYSDLATPREILEAIMKNIIANKGTFVVPKGDD